MWRSYIWLLISMSASGFAAENSLQLSAHYPQNVFSPRMDFEQWKPLTGRGDPLRNDPTYDYEPPMLDKVHYWIDPASRKPDDSVKSEVLLLGVSSKKPSVPPTTSVKREGVEGFQKLMSSLKNSNIIFTQHPRPSMPSRQRPMSISFPPISSNKVKYEDYNYKYTENNMPMTILVPPPPPPAPPVQYHQLPNEETLNEYVHLPALENDGQEKNETAEKYTFSSSATIKPTSPYLSVEESNLIYQSSSSSVGDHWNFINKTELPNISVDSNYEGWGPTIPTVSEISNDTQNQVNSLFDKSEIQYSLYRPMFSEIPPPIPKQPEIPNEIPENEKPLNAVPDIMTTTLATTTMKTMSSIMFTTSSPSLPSTTHRSSTTPLQRETQNVEKLTIKPTLPTHASRPSLLGMLGPMMEMPGIFKNEVNFRKESSIKEKQILVPPRDREIEYMQTMQPPPVIFTTEKIPSMNIQTLPTKVISEVYSTKQPSLSSTSPPSPIFATSSTTLPTDEMDPIFASYVESKPSSNQGPLYVIIEGHSKVKTYGPKNKTPTLQKNIDDSYESKEIQQVKHLHSSKEKDHFKKNDKKKSEKTRNGRTLKHLVSDGEGLIEIHEANLGIQFDVSDGSEVPEEIYKKGFVEAEENFKTNDKTRKKTGSRQKRQIDLASILPVDPDKIDEYLYDYLKKKSQENSITGYLASAVTSDAAEVVDDLEEEVSLR